MSGDHGMNAVSAVVVVPEYVEGHVTCRRNCHQLHIAMESMNNQMANRVTQMNVQVGTKLHCMF